MKTILLKEIHLGPPLTLLPDLAPLTFFHILTNWWKPGQLLSGADTGEQDAGRFSPHFPDEKTGSERRGRNRTWVCLTSGSLSSPPSSPADGSDRIAEAEAAVPLNQDLTSSSPPSLHHLLRIILSQPLAGSGNERGAPRLPRV